MKQEQVASDFLEALTKVSRRVRTAFNQQVTAHGLTYPRARALFRLAKRQNMTQTELACELELEQATLVRLLDRMEENGLIERQPDPNDRRAKLIKLTSHGEEQAAFVRAIADQLRAQIFEGIDLASLSNAVDLMERISTNIAEMEDLNVPA
ncbi:MarR family winged helix-turn-helix transcriptional regulator [Neorhizobium alkalisoli]|jgi:MarR family transcriptional regulator for hemolysin|uniref:MarR family transcriptional regulator n=1 Tax=Neorhizobium alkalisoli TaxID=528178 RepID=A0A561R6P5_9HYPH|nr:MarR family transcriptional regulator [Neorhizobium alkalisoli]TWF58280.1 MarR family transcriptional regulator [Neorhizobium alkalisoli]